MNNRPIDHHASLPAKSAPPRSMRGLLMRRCPAAIIAVVVAGGAVAAAHFLPWARAVVPFTPFVPGAIQRTNWRHLLAAIVCGVLAMASQAGLHSIDVEQWYVISYIVNPAVAMLLVGAMEWLLKGRPGKEQLASVLAACLGAAAIFAIVEGTLACMGKTISITGPGDRFAQYQLADVVYFPLEGLLLWIAIPMGLSPSPRHRSVALGASAAALVLYLACATIYIFDVARESLVGHGPFSRSASARVLGQRGSDADFATIWEAVRTADWDQGHPWYEGTDYRLECVTLLANHDRKDTAERLAGLLESECKQQLADVAAPLVAEYRNFDAAPVLLRFACLNDQTCIAALEQLKVPQVAFARLFWAAIEESSQYKRRSIEKGELPKDVPISKLKVPEELQKQLVSLLGPGKGDTVGNWEEYYKQVIGSRPTPLTKELAEQCNRVVETFNDWWFLQGKWAEIKQHRTYWLAIEKMKAAGLKKQVDLIESSANADAEKEQIQLPKEKTPLYEALAAMEPYISAAQAEIVNPPRVDLEATGIDGLEMAVADYKDWVDKEYAIEFPQSAKGKQSAKDKQPDKGKQSAKGKQPANSKDAADKKEPAKGK